MLKNLTITADEDVLQWAKHEAIEKGVSVSKLVGDILAEKMQGSDSYQKAFERWRQRKPVPGADASQRWTREEVNERR